MACRVVNSVLTGQKVNSETWDAMFKQVSDEHFADKLYAQLLTPQFKAWFGDWTTTILPHTTKDGEPIVKNGLITNAFGERKSILNFGSYLTDNNEVSIVTMTDAPVPELEGGEINKTAVYQGGKEIGTVYSENDGTYLTTFDVDITRGLPNAGTYAILQLAEEAQSKGLQLRSDRISDRMSEAYIKLWERFVKTGQAEIQGDHYVFTGLSNNVTNNIFYSLSDMSSVGKLTGENIETEKGQIGVNKQQLLMLLGPTMYNKPLAQVAVKELLQNSFDAIKTAQNLAGTKVTSSGATKEELETKIKEAKRKVGEARFNFNKANTEDEARDVVSIINQHQDELNSLEDQLSKIGSGTSYVPSSKPGNIDIKVDYGNRTISIKDDGIGMTPDIVKNAFLSIGGTNKEGLDVSERSGGFGLAKVQFLLGSEYVKVITVRDGIKTSLSASAIELYNDDFSITTEKTDEPNGSFVEVKIPESYTTPEGTKRNIDFPGQYGEPWKKFSILDKPLIGNLNVNFSYKRNGTEETVLLPIGKNSTEETLPPLFSNIEFSWGTADLYMSTEKKEKNRETHRILSSGIYQFDYNFRWKDYEDIPYDIVVNIKPSVGSTAEQYPFNNQREGFKNTVSSDISALGNFLKKYASGEAEKDAIAVFSNIAGLPKVDPNKILTPEEREKLYADVQKTIDENEKRRLEQGKDSAEEEFRKITRIFIGNGSVKNKDTGEEISKEKDYNSTFKSNRDIENVAPIETGTFNPALPQYHNNTNVDYLKIPGAAEFFSDFGSVVLDLVRFAGNEFGYDYNKLKSEERKFFAGVSIDKQYGGVHVSKIIDAIFINPLSFDAQSLEEAVGLAFHITLHEINHTTASGEGARFTTDLAKLYGKIYASGKYGLYEGLFRSVYKKHFETFKTLRNEYDKSTTRNLSESFKGDEIKASSSGDVQGYGTNVQAGQASEQGYTGDTGDNSQDKAGDVILDKFSENNNLKDSIVMNLKLSGKYSMIPEMALDTLSKNGLVSKFNPHSETVDEDRWYFNQSKGLNNSEMLFHQYMAMNNLNEDMFKISVSANGISYLTPNRNFDLSDAIQENNEKIHKEKYEAIINFFVNKFGIKEGQINYITKKEFAEKFPEQYKENMQSAYHNDNFYFFTHNLTADITTEELLHPFIYTVKQLNPELFANLLAEAQRHYPALLQKIQVLYKSQLQSIRDQELVTQALARVFNNDYEKGEPKSFFEVIKDFVKWMRLHLNTLLNYFGTGKTIHISVTDLHPLTSLEEISQLLNATDTKFDVIFPKGTMYNIAYNSDDFNKAMMSILTDSRIEASVEKTLSQLPSALKDVRKRLTSSINDNEKKELQSIIKDIEELMGEDKHDLLKAQMKGILTTVQLFNTLSDELNTVDRSDMDSSLKLGYYMSVFKTAQALGGFKDIMLELNNEIKTHLRTDGANAHVKEFRRLIESAISAEDNISFKIQKLIVTPLLDELVKSNEYTYMIPINKIDEQIRGLERDIQATASLKDKEKLQDKISVLNTERGKILEKAPTRENLQKVFDSEFKDANSLSYIFESSIANGHPLVNTLQNIVNIIYDRAGGDMLYSKNEAQTQSDKFSKATGRGMRNMKSRFEGIGDDLVKLPVRLKFKKGSESELELDDKGNPQFEHVQQKALVQEVDNAYITKYMELEMVKEHYRALLSTDLVNNVENSEYKSKFEEARDAFEEFKKENSEREFTEEYYAFRAMLDEKIGDRTIRQITGNIYDEIDRLRDEASRADSVNRAQIFEAIRDAEVKLKYLKSENNLDGSKKEGDDLRIAKVLTDYGLLRKEFGDDVLTEEGKTKYKFDLDAIEFKKDQYSKDDYRRLISNLQQTKISPEYFDALASITDSINSLTNMLSENIANSEIAKYLQNNQYKDKRKDIYKEIRDLVRPFRDEDQVIDGITLTRINPELVTKIRDMQQYIEDLKYQTTKMWALSAEESNEYQALRKNRQKTAEEEARYQDLIKKKDDLRNFRKENEDIIDQIISLFSELGNISTNVNTDYYVKMLDKQLLDLKNDESLADQAILFIEGKERIKFNNTYYSKEDGRWYEEQTLGKKTEKIFLGDENIATSTGYPELLSLAVAFLAKETLKTTQWWKDNHFTAYEYDSKTGLQQPVERAIYIWEHQQPNNPNFIEVSPARKYYDYQVKSKYVNDKYDVIYKSIPQAKREKWVNKRYAESMADPAKAEFLTYLRNHYSQVQEILPDYEKMGHILPAIVKTEGENAVDTTNKIATLDFRFKEMFATNAGKTDTDTSYLFGGSQENKQTIPIRFTGKMDTAKQTDDALAAILMFEYHASLYKSLNDQLPIFEASQLLAAKVGTTERTNVVEKLGFGDKLRRIFSSKEGEKETIQKKKVEKSVLSKSVDNIVETFVYGQRLKPMIVDLGPFGKVDLAKVSTGVLGFAAKSIFIGNIISAINNSLSTRLQAIVNSGIKSNLYSINNLKNGQARAVKYGPALLRDWTKLGNKSLIGQVLDKFAMLAENPGREITKKSEFTYLKNKMEFLTSAKQMSEFEVLFVQFLTMADATPVKVNGKVTPLSHIEDIFEKDKNGNLKYKDGVEFSKQQEDIFRGMFQSMARKLAGAYRVTEISSIETNWVGKSALFLRRYFVSMATNRFAGERWNSQEMEVQLGYQRETFRNLIKMFRDYQHLGMQQWSKMTAKERASFHKTILEYGILMLLIGLLALAGGNDDKKHLKKNSWQYNIMLVALVRARAEMEQFTIKGTDDLIRIGKTPFVIFNTIGNVYKIISLVGPTMMGWKQAFYQQNTGMHKKGDSKLVYTLLKLRGWGGIMATRHPEEYYMNFLNAQNR